MRMSVGLVTGEKLTFCYRTPEDASHAAQQLDATGAGESAYGTPDDVQSVAAVQRCPEVSNEPWSSRDV